MTPGNSSRLIVTGRASTGSCSKHFLLFPADLRENDARAVLAYSNGRQRRFKQAIFSTADQAGFQAEVARENDKVSGGKGAFRFAAAVAQTLRARRRCRGNAAAASGKKDRNRLRRFCHQAVQLRPRPPSPPFISAPPLRICDITRYLENGKLRVWGENCNKNFRGMSEEYPCIHKQIQPLKMH